MLREHALPARRTPRSAPVGLRGQAVDGSASTCLRAAAARRKREMRVTSRGGRRAHLYNSADRRIMSSCSGGLASTELACFDFPGGRRVVESAMTLDTAGRVPEGPSAEETRPPEARSMRALPHKPSAEEKHTWPVS